MADINLRFRGRDLYGGASFFAFAADDFVGLLDTYPNAAFAYSFRKLRNAYAGSAVRLREQVGNTEQDIGFDGSGNFDLAAAATFAAGLPVNIAVWYDQSGNGLDLSQATESNQPLYTASGIGFLPCATFDGSDDSLARTFDLSPLVSTQGTFFIVLNCLSDTQMLPWCWNGGGDNRLNSHHTYGAALYFDFNINTGRISGSNASTINGADHICEAYRNSSDLQEMLTDGVSIVSDTRTGDLSTASGGFTIGTGAGLPYEGKISELVGWGTDLGP